MILQRDSIIKFLSLSILLGIGILTKNSALTDSGFIRNHLGGIIYVVFWILFCSLLFSNAAPLKIVLWVFFITCSIEFTQLIHTPSLDFYRTKFLIQALFGSTFNGFDIFWYFVAAVCGYIFLLILKTYNHSDKQI